MAESVKRFYVLKVISGKENKVREAIETEAVNLNLQQYIGRVLVPTEKVMTMRNGKKVMKDRPILPGYVIVEADLVGEVQYVLKSTADVLGFLGERNGVLPTPLREAEVVQMLGRNFDADGNSFELDYSFSIGEVVKITDGPFKNCDATVEEVYNDKKKLKVIVKVFGRRTPLELSFLEVEKE